MRSVFGWSLPPGVTNRMIDEQMSGPCAVCGASEDDCVCPECHVCGTVGDPKCYAEDGHGLVLTCEQIVSAKEAASAAAKKEKLFDGLEAADLYWDALEEGDLASAIGWASRASPMT
jgi:hypothetical protein